MEEILYSGIEKADLEVFQRVLDHMLRNLIEQEQARGN